jgi:hypothetical protein
MTTQSAFEAIWKNDLYALTAALDAGIDPNTKGVKGWTLLMEAVYRNQLHMVDVLLSRGANVYHSDPNGQTAMHFATYYCIDGVFRRIFSAAGPRAMNVPDCHGETPLYWLVIYACAEQVAFVLSHPFIDVSARTFKGRTPLKVSARFRTFLQTYGDQEARWQPIRYTWIKLLI